MWIIFNLCAADNLILRIRKFSQNFDHLVNYDDDTLMHWIHDVRGPGDAETSFVGLPQGPMRLKTCTWCTAKINYITQFLGVKMLSSKLSVVNKHERSLVKPMIHELIVCIYVYCANVPIWINHVISKRSGFMNHCVQNILNSL